MRIKLTSASTEVEVEVRAELGKKILGSEGLITGGGGRKGG